MIVVGGRTKVVLVIVREKSDGQGSGACLLRGAPRTEVTLKSAKKIEVFMIVKDEDVREDVEEEIENMERKREPSII